MGDDGGARDFVVGQGVLGNRRNKVRILGSILRIDPFGNNSSNGQYGIPIDYSFVNAPRTDDIYAFGFLNPFRMSFDANTRKLYPADVRQNADNQLYLRTDARAGSLFKITELGDALFLPNEESESAI